MSNIPEATAAIAEAAALAASTDTKITTFGVTVAPSGYYFIDGVRISQDRAVAIVAQSMAEAPAAVAAAAEPKPFTWDRLNAATQATFIGLCEQMLEATRDHSLAVPVRLGKDIAPIALVDAPRITNLKRAGLLATYPGTVKSHRMLSLTPEGRAKWAEMN
jgi:hypothetical protein